MALYEDYADAATLGNPCAVSHEGPCREDLLFGWGMKSDSLPIHLYSKAHSDL